MNKGKQVIMVEFINDANDWEWYAVIENGTPARAVEYYENENGLEHGGVENDTDTTTGGVYSKLNDVRAYPISLIKITK